MKKVFFMLTLIFLSNLNALTKKDFKDCLKEANIDLEKFRDFLKKLPDDVDFQQIRKWARENLNKNKFKALVGCLRGRRLAAKGDRLIVSGAPEGSISLVDIKQLGRGGFKPGGPMIPSQSVK